MKMMSFLRRVNKSQILSQVKNSGQLPNMMKISTVKILPTLEESRKDFQDTLPIIINNLMDSPGLKELPDVADWIKKILQHNLSNGKHSRDLTFYAYEMLERLENITEEKLKQSRVLGWCVEMQQNVWSLIDDILDESTTRHGQTVWYRMPHVGMGALNDAILMNNCIREILDIYFGDKTHLSKLIRIFEQAMLTTAIGQHMDCAIAKTENNDFSLYTMERYDNIAKHKCGYLLFELPVNVALTLVNNYDEKTYDTRSLDVILAKLGKLYQITDDYLDCYGDDELTGKIGTDIEERKCTWLAVTALQHSNKKQREFFEKYFGRKEPEHVTRIKDLYDELNIPVLHKKAELELYEEINQLIKELPPQIQSSFFNKLTDRLYKRNIY